MKEKNLEGRGEYETDEEFRYATEGRQKRTMSLSQAILNALSQSNGDVMAQQRAVVQYLALLRASRATTAYPSSTECISS
jgi:hypothetical protein